MSSWAWFAIMNKKYSGNQTGAKAVDTAEEPQAGTAAGRGERRFALGLFHLIERLLLVVVVAMTVLAVIFEILTIYGRGNILLADVIKRTGRGLVRLRGALGLAADHTG